MRRARADNATVVVSIFVNPRQFNVASDFTRYPRNEARDLAMCEAEGVDLVFAPEVEEIYPPGFATTVSVGAVAAAAGGRGPTRPLRWRRDRRGDPVRPGRRGARVLRPEGRAAGHGHPPDGARPRDRHRGRGLSHGPRAGRPRALVAQRAPLARTSAPRRRSCAGRCSRRATRGAPASARATRCATRCAEILAAEPLADVEYVSVADGLTLAELDDGRSAGAGVAGRPLRRHPPDRQRDPRPDDGNRRRLSGVRDATGGAGRGPDRRLPALRRHRRTWPQRRRRPRSRPPGSGR